MGYHSLLLGIFPTQEDGTIVKIEKLAYDTLGVCLGISTSCYLLLLFRKLKNFIMNDDLINFLDWILPYPHKDKCYVKAYNNNNNSNNATRWHKYFGITLKFREREREILVINIAEKPKSISEERNVGGELPKA